MDAITQGWRVGWLLLLLLLNGTVNAVQVGVLAPNTAPAISQLVQALEQQFLAPVPVFRSLDDDGVNDIDWWVLAGVEAQQQALTLRKPSVAIFVSRAQWQSFDDEQRSAIYLEPPLQRQLNLARLLLGEQRSFGILAAQEASGVLAGTLLEQRGVTTYFVDQYDSLNHALTQLLRHHAAVVGDYDTALFSAEHIKTILITAYRHNKPLIGPSSAYLRAGALASTFSDVAHIAQRLQDMQLHYQQHGVLLPASYNPYFHVRFNEQVARSLNIPLPDEDDAQHVLQRKESQP